MEGELRGRGQSYLFFFLSMFETPPQALVAELRKASRHKEKPDRRPTISKFGPMVLEGVSADPSGDKSC